MPTLDEVIAFIEDYNWRVTSDLNPYEQEVVRAIIAYLKELKKSKGE